MSNGIFTKYELKILCINALSRLEVCVPYLLDYAENRRVYLFDCDDGWNGRRIVLNSEVDEKIAELQRNHNVQVYSVTHEKFDFGEVYTFLCISRYIEDFDQMLKRFDNGIYRAYAYAWNKTSEECSEFGSVFLEVADGKLRRVG